MNTADCFRTASRPVARATLVAVLFGGAMLFGVALRSAVAAAAPASIMV